MLAATALERSLYLLLQVQELGLPVLGVVNMIDEAATLGQTVDTDRARRAPRRALRCGLHPLGQRARPAARRLDPAAAAARSRHKNSHGPLMLATLATDNRGPQHDRAHPRRQRPPAARRQPPCLRAVAAAQPPRSRRPDGHQRGDPPRHAARPAGAACSGPRSSISRWPGRATAASTPTGPASSSSGPRAGGP
ncbi:MAG: hypothetical protein IPG96_18530 [Proteobacteria bacterium]|nr:hypothetical protein [Pseudomonadota bacterium]